MTLRELWGGQDAGRSNEAAEGLRAGLQSDLIILGKL